MTKPVRLISAIIAIAVVIVLLVRFVASRDANALDLTPPRLEWASLQPAVADACMNRYEALRAEPESVAGWYNYAAVLDAHKRVELAEQCYRTALALDPTMADAQYNLGALIQHLEGRTDEALALFEEALNTLDAYAPLHVRVGRMRLELGQAESAASAFERALQLETGLPAALLGLGQARLAAGDAEAALDPLERVAQSAPDDVRAVAALAQVYRRLDRPDEASDAASRARGLGDSIVLRDPKRDTVLALAQDAFTALQRGLVAADAGQYQAAIPHFEVAARHLQDNALLQFQFGMSLYYVGDAPRAIPHLEQALTINDDLHDARLLLATIHLQFRRAAQCETLCREVIARDPGEMRAYGLLAVAQATTGRPADAVAALEQAAVAGTPDASMRLTWGNVLMDLGRTDPAIEQYETALALQPGHPGAHFNLAAALERLGRIDEAIAHCRAALAADPNMQPARDKLRSLEARRPG